MIRPVQKHLADAHKLFAQVANDSDLHDKIERAAAKIIACFQQGHRLFIAGNGGSAADAQHFAAELVGWYHRGDKPLPALALSTDTSFLTAWSNDASYEEVFSRQLRAHGKEGDIFFALSTSGMSPNIVDALHTARELRIGRIALLGNDGGSAMKLADTTIVVPSSSTPHIQEVHIAIIHAICECLSPHR